MNWERHHIEVVSAAAADRVTRASDLLREHLASVGCDPLAVRITARLREPTARDDDLEDLASQLPGCHATPWPGPLWTP
jgi:DNA-binding GntR family transcriptional regulator